MVYTYGRIRLGLSCLGGRTVIKNKQINSNQNRLNLVRWSYEVKSECNTFRFRWIMAGEETAKEKSVIARRVGCGEPGQQNYFSPHFPRASRDDFFARSL
jgi:hypothetical protein